MLDFASEYKLPDKAKMNRQGITTCILEDKIEYLFYFYYYVMVMEFGYWCMHEKQILRWKFIRF